MQTQYRLFAALCVLSLGACAEDSSGTGNAMGHTDLAILLSASGEQTGSAEGAVFGDIRASAVTFSGIYIQTDPGEAAAGADTEGRIWLSRDAITANLELLANAAMTLVESSQVASDVRGELHVVIDGAFVAVTESDGSISVFATSPDYPGLPENTSVDGELTVAGNASGDIAIPLPEGGLTIRGEEQALLVEFDVTESFRFEATIDAWVMHPEIAATDVAATGSIEVETELGTGVTLPSVMGNAAALADLQVRLTDTHGSVRIEALANVDTDARLEAVFPFCDPAEGPFTIELVGLAGLVLTTEPAMPAQVEVSAGESTQVLVTVTGTESTVALAGSLAVSLVLEAGVELPFELSLSEFTAHLSNASGEVASAAFTEVSGSWEVVFDGLATGGYHLDITAAQGISFDLASELPEVVAVDAESITWVDVALSAVALAE